MISDIIGMALFGLLGIAALVAAIFFGATHQIFIASVCAIILLTFYKDYKEDMKAKK